MISAHVRKTALDIRRLYVKRCGGCLDQVKVEVGHAPFGWSATLRTVGLVITINGALRRGWALTKLWEHVNTAFPAESANQVRHAFRALLAVETPHISTSQRSRIEAIAKAIECQANLEAP